MTFKEAVMEDKVVYSNSTYEVRKYHTEVYHNAERMNWVVINKRYQTEESTVSALPNAIYIANHMDSALSQLMNEDEFTLN